MATGTDRVGLDWRACKGHLHVIPGNRRKCRHCTRPTWLMNCAGQAAHKVCEEAWLNGEPIEVEEWRKRGARR